jgi:hypothetical protein
VLHTLLAHDVPFDIHVHIIVSSPFRFSGFLSPAYKSRVHFHEVSSAMWQQLFSTRLGVNVSYLLENSGKKLADFKPMLAYLFPDIVSIDRYDYWIYGDFDGIFGSFDDLFDPKYLFRYDILSGFVPMQGNTDLFNFGYRDHHSLGAWTMLRNKPEVTSLFKKCRGYRSVIENGEKIFYFDENTAAPASNHESFHEMLQRDVNIRKCCVGVIKPPVLRNPINSKIVIELYSDFLKENSETVIRWEKGKTVKFVFSGIIGPKARAFKYSNIEYNAGFVHFLDWKYSNSDSFSDSLHQFISKIESLPQKYTEVSCFELRASSAEKAKGNSYFSFRMC